MIRAVRIGCAVLGTLSAAYGTLVLVCAMRGYAEENTGAGVVMLVAALFFLDAACVEDYWS